MISRRVKQLKCIDPDCPEPPRKGGYCEQHHKERVAKDRRRSQAHVALHQFMVEGKPFEVHVVREEMLHLRQWWFDACDVLSLGTERKVPKNEAEHVISWCTTLAQELVDAECRGRAGGTTESHALSATRHWVWERLCFLEAGLRSNGLPRSKT